jgi:Transposase DDE domain
MASCKVTHWRKTMQLPSSQKIRKQFARLLQALPAEWKKFLYELKAFHHGGKIQTPEELMRLIFLYCGVDLSTKLVAAELTLSEGEKLTGEAVRQRLIKSLAFMKEILRKLLNMNDISAVSEGLRFLSPDGTELANRYRLHLLIDLFTLQFVDAQVGSKKKGESLKNFQFRRGDVVAPDQGYCSYAGILRTVLEEQADVLMRWKHDLLLYSADEKQEALDLCDILKDQEAGTISSFRVVVKYSKSSRIKDKRQVKGWLYAYKMTEEQAKKSDRKVTKAHKRKNRKLSPRTIFLSQFVLVFTTLPPEILDPASALEVYRCRWQIELAIKRLKGLIELSKFRIISDGPLAEVYIYGKLIYLLLIDKMMRSSFGESLLPLAPTKRKLTPSGPYQLIKKALDSSLIDMTLWRKESFQDALEVLMERPRKRQLQTLPPRVIAFQALFKALEERGEAA